jgi:hypothetical protein
LGTFVVLPTLLVHRAVGHGFHVRDESVIIDAVLQEPREAQSVDVVGHVGVECDLVSQGERKTGVFGVGVVDVGFNAVEAVGLALLEPGVQDRLQDGPLTDVDVTLVRVPRQFIAEDAGRVRAGVGAIVFPCAGFQITQRFGARGVDLRDQGGHLGFGTGFRAVVIDVVHLDGAEVGRDGDRPAQVVLPRAERARLPPGRGGMGLLPGY